MTNAIKATSRIPIGKKLRFSIFERDNFTCQYCGKNPQDHNIILNLDHAVSVKDGGDNSAENLITSCWDCNIGKGARSVLQKESVRNVEEELEKANERLVQIKAMIRCRAKLEEATIEIEKIEYNFISCFDIYTNSDNGELEVSEKVKSLIKKRKESGVDLDILRSSVQITFDKFKKEDEVFTSDILKYLNAVIRNKKLEKEDPEEAERKKQINSAYYKACNNFNYVNKRLFYYFTDRIGVDFVLEFIEEARNWSVFREWCEEKLNQQQQNG